jgi:hypothetical protein
MAGSSVNCGLPKWRVRGRNRSVFAKNIVSPTGNHGALQNYLEIPKLFGNSISKYFPITSK